MLTCVFRVDASVSMGSGHVMRCLTLADALHEQGIKIIFICRELPGHMCQFIEGKGYEVYYLPYNVQAVNDTVDERTVWLGKTWQTDAKQTGRVLQDISATFTIHWLIVDHYGLDIQWEQGMKPYIQRIMVIDDLADRSHDCDLLLDQTFGQSSDRYVGLIPDYCQGLYGDRYILLRPEFRALRLRGMLSWGETQIIVHVFFGGMDQQNYTTKFARLLLENFSFLKVKILVGASYSEIKQLSELVSDFKDRIDWQKNVSNVAEHMAQCTVAIGAPGSATWERACVGLPASYLAIVDNQKSIVELLSESGLCSYLGCANTISDRTFINNFAEFLNDKDKLLAMRNIGLANIDGNGTERVVAKLNDGCRRMDG